MLREYRLVSEVSMKKFVQNKAGEDENQARGSVINAQDFKQELPQTRLGNHSRQQSGKQYGAHSAQQHAQHYQQDNGHSNFDSDVGSAADTTADLTDDYTKNQHMYNNAQSAAQQGHQIHEDHDQETASVDDHGDDYDDQDEIYEDGEESIGYIQSGQTFEVSKREQPEEYARLKNLFAMRQATLMDADSYPATTSGVPSVVAAEPKVDQHTHLQQMQQGQARASNFQQPIPANLEHRTTRPVSRQQDQGFQKLAPAKHQPRHSHIPVHTQPSHQHQQVHTVQTQGEPSQGLDDHRRQSQIRQKSARPEQSMRNPGRGNVNPNKIEPGLMNVPTKASRPQQVSMEMNNGQHTPQEPQSSLDYDVDILYKKTFSELQAANYDVDPRTQPDGHHPIDKEDIERQLQDLLSASDQQQQMDFLASLDMEEWDQAGDWFLSRFGEMMTAFKNARSEKRKLSREYETKIAERYEAISAKRKLTDEALKAMKASGANVLDTPKKMKQTRK